jgi:hypothetical protein
MMFLARILISAAILFAAAVATTQAQNSACQGVQFSAAVLDRFPGARASCLDVIERDGQQYAVFKAQLTEVRGNSLRIRVKSPDGTYGPATRLEAKPDRRVLIDGKPYRVSELAPNQELTAYVRVDTPQIALAPVTAEEPIETFPLAEQPEAAGPVQLSSAAAPSMPQTASKVGILAVMGGFLLVVAAILTTMRMSHRRSS